MTWASKRTKMQEIKGFWGGGFCDLEASWDFCSRGVGVGGGVGRKL